MTRDQNQGPVHQLSPETTMASPAQIQRWVERFEEIQSTSRARYLSSQECRGSGKTAGNPESLCSLLKGCSKLMKDVLQAFRGLWNRKP